MQEFINLAYIAASILFIFGIKMLGNASTARRGNFLSSLGMLLAVVVTLLNREIITSYSLIVGGLALGASIGFIWAKRVQMTGMPELVALFNGFGGLASLLVGWAEYARGSKLEWVATSYENPSFTVFVIVLAILIGGITFTGSIVAYLKLSGKMGGSPTNFPGQNAINASLFLALLGVGVFLAVNYASGSATIAFYTVMGIALLLGILGVIPIGGGDMPVVISMPPPRRTSGGYGTR